MLFFLFQLRQKKGGEEKEHEQMLEWWMITRGNKTPYKATEQPPLTVAER